MPRFERLAKLAAITICFVVLPTAKFVNEGRELSWYQLNNPAYFMVASASELI